MVALFTGAFVLLIGWTWFTQPRPVQGEQATPPKATAGEPSDLEARFTREIWPLLTRSQASCVACHTKSNPSQLHFPADAQSSFRQLVAEGRLDPHSPGSLLARITTADPAQRMPPTGMPGWTEAEQARLRDFMAALAAGQVVSAGAPQADEQFPDALRLPYTGPRSPAVGLDNSLLSYYQLRHKIALLFGDDWRRDNRDLYLENLAQIGGADFQTRYDESARPTPSYLSAVGALAGDVAARAYLNKTGPFAGRPEAMPLPGVGQDAAVRTQIARLYQSLLFRKPTSEEFRASSTLLGAVAHAASPSRIEPLMFQVTARDDAGQRAVEQATVELLPAGQGVSAVYVNENVPTGEPQARLGVWTLKPGDATQRLEVLNRDTSGKVTFRGLTLRGPLPDATEKTIGADAPGITVEGSWNAFGPNGKDGYSDGDNNKGKSRLVVPLRVDKPGRYEIHMAWRKNEDGANSDAVPVMVYARGAAPGALPPAPPVPPRGEAHFTVDETVDNVPSWNSSAAFRFDVTQPQSGLEIANAGTRRRVVADAVSFLPAADAEAGPALTVKSDDALGHENWPVFEPKDFTPYNTIGPHLHSDENAHKGELRLLFSPGDALRGAQYFHVRLTYPGHVNNETRVPVTVYAAQSSPIVRLRAPVEAPVGARITLDAGASYNVQHSRLHFTWTQIGGPRATLTDPHAPTLTVRVPPGNAAQTAWQALCRALVLHPDFLFTRPRSLATVTDPATRRRLQLVKLAQDLVGRPPTSAEVARVDHGASLAALADSYLASDEFERFYYRRVRLYLESHGTPTQDEPVRLWRYLLHNNRPYTELLTADYTITPDGKKEARPAAAGHSGLLSMPGFIEGKPGLPHFNYAAQVCEKFLSYRFEVTPEIVKARGTLTAASTVDPKSLCYSCHQVLTPLAFQRSRWTDDGKYREKDADGKTIDDTDRAAVAAYPFKGRGLEAFALAAQNKERFHRSIIQTHFSWFFGRQMRYDADERGLYKRLWDADHKNHFTLRPLVRALVTSPEYLGDVRATPRRSRLAHR